jgi:hypothetical protein
VINAWPPMNGRRSRFEAVYDKTMTKGTFENHAGGDFEAKILAVMQTVSSVACWARHAGPHRSAAVTNMPLVIIAV